MASSPVPGRPARIAAAAARFAGRFPWLVVAACGLLAAAGAWAAAARLTYHTQRNDLLSADKQCQKRWQKYRDAFGDDDDLVIVIRGGDAARKKAAADVVAEKLAARPDVFDRVFHRVDLRPLAPRALYFLPTDQLHAVEKNLDGMSPLLGPLAPVAWRALSVQTLLGQAADAERRHAAGEPLSPAEAELRNQTPRLLAAATAAVTAPDVPTANVWQVAARPAGTAEMLTAPQYFLTADGALAVVLARPAAAENSFTPAKPAADAARAILAELGPRFPDLQFGLTGLPVLESDEMQASEADSTRASWLALAGVAVLYFVAYRGVRYPLFTVATLLCGTAWALGWATLTVGHLNILSAAFAVMIIGMGDYGVLWVARYDDARRDGRNHADALSDAAVHAGPGVLTAAFTTALAFFATMLADFRAVAELGWIAGWGVLFCAAACFTLLPALLTLTTRPVPPAERAPPRRHFLPVLASRPGAVLAGAGFAFVVAVAAAGLVKYDANLLNMQADGLDSVAWEHELIRHTAGATWDALGVATTREDALALKAKYESTPGVGRVVEAASLVPDDQGRKTPVVAAVRRKLAGLPDTPPSPLPPTVSALRALLKRGPQSPEWAAFAAAAERFPDADLASRLHAFDRKLSADLHTELRNLKAVATPEPIALSDLPAPFRERYVGTNGEFLVRAFASENLWEFAELERFTTAAAAANPESTGKAYRTLEGLRQMRHGFERAGLAALAVIVAVLWLDFRTARGVLLGLLPLLLGVTLTLGAMGLFGVPLNPANLIALPLIVGVGVDNGVHVLHDFHSRRGPGPYRLSAAAGRGILISALTTVLGFGTLMVSRHRGMAGLGLALALGVSFCMAAALVVLPAVLGTRFRFPPVPAFVPIRKGVLVRTAALILIAAVGVFAVAAGPAKTPEQPADPNAGVAAAAAGKLKLDDAAGLMDVLGAAGLPANRAALEQMKDHGRTAAARFGPPLGQVELVKRETIGTSFDRFTYLVRYTSGAVGWQVGFYRGDAGWTACEVNWSIDLRPLFEAAK